MLVVQNQAPSVDLVDSTTSACSTAFLLRIFWLNRSMIGIPVPTFSPRRGVMSSIESVRAFARSAPSSAAGAAAAPPASPVTNTKEPNPSKATPRMFSSPGDSRAGSMPPYPDKH
ncbi:hypothetical protein GCM10009550_52950 [Actinocorallia libanotica]|uniref:Uncharacterized protein n=1 Tax=Actinocorallia libanotica TaxID=46162 RepID=A0ABN1RP90_9ACTN